MISGALAYCRARMKALGRSEWDDPNFETLPHTRLSASYHLELGDAQSVSVAHDHQLVNVPVTLRVPYAPTRKPTALADEAIAFADKVIVEFVKAQNRLNQEVIKNVTFNTMAVEPLNESDDNSVILKIVFNTLVIISTR